MTSNQSSIGRLMLVVLTAAIGFMTMKTQADFWLGCLVTTTGGWMLLALNAAIGERGTGRRSARAFLLATSISLFAGFGPWSDSSIRTRIFETGFLSTHEQELWPTSIAFIRISHHLKPRWRGSIVADQDGKAAFELSMTAERGGPVDVEDISSALLQPIHRSSIRSRLSSTNGRPMTLRVSSLSLDVYLNACYLLFSLVVGGLAGIMGRLTFRLASNGLNRFALDHDVSSVEP